MPQQWMGTITPHVVSGLLCLALNVPVLPLTGTEHVIFKKPRLIARCASTCKCY